MTRTCPRLVSALLAATVLAGCSSIDEAQPPAARVAPDAPPDLIEGWSSLDPREAGFAQGHLQESARVARRSGASCFAVVRDGKLVKDWNWDMARLGAREVFSVTKSVTSALVGIAVGDGALGLDDRVSDYIPQWRDTESADVTVRHLLANDSGRFWSEDSDYVQLVRSSRRTAYAVGLDQQHEPGTSWAYNNAAIQVLDAVLAQATGMPTDEFAAERLFGPLGMERTRLTRDASGRGTSVFFGMRTSCLDLARFGQLYLDGGKVDGERILPSEFVRASVGRPSTELNAAYGLLWWLNRRGELRGSTDDLDAAGQPVAHHVGRLAPFAPADIYAALGLGGQVLLVDPGSNTVVVRLGPLRDRGPEYGFVDAARVVAPAG